MINWRRHKNICRKSDANVGLAPTPIDGQTTRTDVTPTLNRREPMSTSPFETCRLIYRPTTEHAAELLSWMQGPGGRVGFMAWFELHAAYGDMSRELGLEPASWTAVARELRRLVPQPKRYVGKERVRMWDIPAAGVPRQRAPAATA